MVGAVQPLVRRVDERCCGEVSQRDVDAGRTPAGHRQADGVDYLPGFNDPVGRIGDVTEVGPVGVGPAPVQVSFAVEVGDCDRIVRTRGARTVVIDGNLHDVAGLHRAAHLLLRWLGRYNLVERVLSVQLAELTVGTGTRLH